MLLYANQWTEEIVDGHSNRVYSDRIEPGNVLHVNGCFFYFPESVAADPMQIVLQHGGLDVVFRSRAMTATLDGMSIFNPFDMGEGDRLYGYCPNAETGESIVLNVVGILYTLDEWRAFYS